MRESKVPKCKVYTGKKPPSLKYVQLYVGGYVEMVQIDRNIQVLCNEEGLLLDLPVNIIASRLCGRVIVGDVLILIGGAKWV